MDCVGICRFLWILVDSGGLWWMVVDFVDFVDVGLLWNLVDVGGHWWILVDFCGFCVDFVGFSEFC